MATRWRRSDPPPETPLKIKYLPGHDGTRLAYTTWGRGDRWLVVCNGYGGTFGSWEAARPHLEDQLRVLIWDYRGQHNSAIPADRAALRIDDHVRDLRALLAAEGIDRFALCGWSVGVQVALAAWRAMPERVDALVLLAGAHERILHHVLGGKARRFAARAVRATARLAPALLPVVRPAARRLSRAPALLPALHLARVVRNHPREFPAAMAAFIELDFPTFLHMATLADDHETESWLAEVDVPTLLIAGGRDVLTPPAVMRRAHDRIPAARWHAIDDATHYAILEYPREIARLILDHLAARDAA